MEERGIKGTNTVDVEGLENLKPGTGVQVGGDTYEYGADLHTEGTPLIDPGEGKTISIRVFHFKMDPRKVKNFPKDKQLIFNSHAKQIQTILWGDGMRPFDGASPRVIIDAKSSSYNIYVPCEARLGVTWFDKPVNLSEQLLKANKGKLEKPKDY